MTVNAELARCGEPPGPPGGESQASLLSHAVDEMERGEEVSASTLPSGSPQLASQGEALVETSRWLHQFAASLLEHSGPLEDSPADPQAAPGELSTVYLADVPPPDLPSEEFR